MQGGEMGQEEGMPEGREATDKKIAQSFDWAIFGENGRCERIRTSDPLHPMQMRYLAALHTDGVSSADGEGVYGDAPTLSTGEIQVRDRLPALRATSDQSATSGAFCRHLTAVLQEKRPPGGGRLA